MSTENIFRAVITDEDSFKKLCGEAWDLDETVKDLKKLFDRTKELDDAAKKVKGVAIKG